MQIQHLFSPTPRDKAQANLLLELLCFLITLTLKSFILLVCFSFEGFSVLILVRKNLINCV